MPDTRPMQPSAKPCCVTVMTKTFTICPRLGQGLSRNQPHSASGIMCIHTVRQRLEPRTGKDFVAWTAGETHGLTSSNASRRKAARRCKLNTTHELVAIACCACCTHTLLPTIRCSVVNRNKACAYPSNPDQTRKIAHELELSQSSCVALECLFTSQPQKQNSLMVNVGRHVL